MTGGPDPGSSAAADRTVFPALSVVVIAQGTAPALHGCVASFRAAGADEVIVVAAASVPVGESAVVIRSESASFPRLAALGLEASRGELVAFTEWHCTAEPGWAEAVRRAFAHGVDAIGGSVAADRGLSTMDRALYAVDYGAFASGGERDAHVLPGVNVVFRRSALAELEPAAEFWKSFASWELERRGASLRFHPSPRVTYHRRLSFGATTRRRWNHGRCFGAMRARTMRRSAKTLYPLAAPAIPFALTAATTRTIVRYASVLEAIVLLPAVFWIHLVWVAGEWVGHLWGAGKSCDRL